MNRGAWQATICEVRRVGHSRARMHSQNACEVKILESNSDKFKMQIINLRETPKQINSEL